jgi:hypothetical protein
MSADENKDFDANAFENKKAVDALKQVVGKVQAQDGTEVEATQLDAISSNVRNTVTKILKIVDPKSYAKYREMKYAGGDNPTLEQRRSAYQFAFKAFLLATYTKAGV